MQSGDDEHIRRAAYDLWEKEGRPEGRHDHHWHEARQTSGKTVTPEKADTTTEPSKEDTKTPGAQAEAPPAAAGKVKPPKGSKKKG